MDFAQLDLRNASTKEYWVHLRIGDTLLYSDMDKQEKPCKVKMAATTSVEVKAALKTTLREADQVERVSNLLAQEDNNAKREKLKDRLIKLDKALDETLENFLNIAVKDWQNIEYDGKPFIFSSDNLAQLSKVGAPLHRMASEIAQDTSKAQSPFIKAVND